MIKYKQMHSIFLKILTIGISNQSKYQNVLGEVNVAC